MFGSIFLTSIFSCVRNKKGELGEMSDKNDIYRFLSEWPVGKPLKLTIIRGKNRVELEVVPAEPS
jgi:hypothetical protein